MVIHEFVTPATTQEKREANSQDLDRFLARITRNRFEQLEHGRLVGPIHVPGSEMIPSEVPLFVGKTQPEVGVDGVDG